MYILFLTLLSQMSEFIQIDIMFLNIVWFHFMLRYNLFLYLANLLKVFNLSKSTPIELNELMKTIHFNHFNFLIRWKINPVFKYFILLKIKVMWILNATINTCITYIITLESFICFYVVIDKFVNKPFFSIYILINTKLFFICGLSY